MAGDANVLDQSARGALRTQPRQDAKLQATDHRAVTILRDHELNIGITLDRLERFLATTETPQSAETKGDGHER